MITLPSAKSLQFKRFYPHTVELKGFFNGKVTTEIVEGVYRWKVENVGMENEMLCLFKYSDDRSYEGHYYKTSLEVISH